LLIAAIWAGKLALRTLKTQTTQIKLGRSVLDANRRAANAAKDSANTAKTHMYLSLRARMGLQRLMPHNLGANKETNLTLIFENFGGKGAMLQDYCIVATIHPLPPDPVYPKFVELGVPVEAKATYSLFKMIDPPLTDEVWTRVSDEQGSDRLRIYGVLRYQAGLGTKTKRLGFCREYDPRAFCTCT
jgi:hypothetical protein